MRLGFAKCLSTGAMRRQLVLVLSSFLVPLMVFSSVWSPVISHYYVPGTTVSALGVENARHSPPDELLEELSSFRMFPSRWEGNQQLISIAERLLRGQVRIPGYPDTEITVPFSAKDLEKGSEEWQLEFAGLAVPEILLDAYKASGRSEFLAMAREMIVEWSSYESHAWLPKGLLWNDHAIAARVLVLSKFWSLYRHQLSFQPEVGRAVLQMAARSGQLLAKRSHFTFATNHGVMQNLALWHLSVAFPDLPQVAGYKELAFDRLREQMAFYIDDEGVVLEHSAHYHQAGVQFLGMACRYLTLLGMPIPENWLSKYQKSKKFYAILRRGDGTLPTIGDTDGASDLDGPKVLNVDALAHSAPMEYEKRWMPVNRSALYPVSGYSIWWDGLEHWPDFRRLSQTVLAWSYYPGHPHKHADEMSALLWAHGHSWWTNSGYWPDALDGLSDAISWNGSNAPHLVGEPMDSKRETRLRELGESARVRAITLIRNGPGDYSVSRQVLQIDPALWLVLDSTSGGTGVRTTSTWTAAPEISLSAGKFPDSYDFSPDDRGTRMTAFVLGPPGAQVRTFRGSLSPFAGWEVIGTVPRPAPALVVEQSSNDSWSAGVWILQKEDGIPTPAIGAPPRFSWRNPQDWELALRYVNNTVSVVRNGSRIVFGDSANGGKTEVLELKSSGDYRAEVEHLHRAYSQVAAKYPRFKDLLPYRFKVTYFLALLLIAQELSFAVSRRLLGRWKFTLRFLCVGGWVAMGAWLALVYFQT
jgi:hypothetical protein